MKVIRRTDNGGDRTSWALFPNRAVAIAAGEAALQYDLGGFDSADIYSGSHAPSNTLTYATANDWLFD